MPWYGLRVALCNLPSPNVGCPHWCVPAAQGGDTKQPVAWHRQAHHGDENLCLGFRHSDGKKWVPWDVCITSELGREQDFPMVIFFFGDKEDVNRSWTML